MDTKLLQPEMIFICKDLAGVVPTEIQVIPYGEHHTPKGDFVCDEGSEASVINSFALKTNDMVIDYEHQTLMGVEAPAAGWIKKLVNKGKEGIWAVVEWTEKARQYIANREYRYVSPVFLKGTSDNRVLKLINVALTNQPNIDGMVPLINKNVGAGLVPALLGGGQPRGIAPTQKPEKEETMKSIISGLGLPEGSTEEQCVAAINALKAKAEGGTLVVANKAVLEALGLKEGAGESEVVGTIMANKQGHDRIAELTLQVTNLTEELKKKGDDDVVAMVSKAIEDGKVTPAQKDWALEYAKKDPEGFGIFVAKAPVVVVKGEIAGDDAAAAGALDETQIQVNKMLGIDTDTFKKHNPEKEG